MPKLRLLRRVVALLVSNARPADPMAAAFSDFARELTPPRAPSRTRTEEIRRSAPLRAA